MPYSHEEIARNKEAIRTKAFAALLPIQREMKLMGWNPELQSMMWQAVLRLALDRMADAVELARSGGLVTGQGPVGAGRDVTEDSGNERSRPVDL